MKTAVAEVRPVVRKSRSERPVAVSPWLTIEEMAAHKGISVDAALDQVLSGPIVGEIRDGRIMVDARSLLIEAVR